MTIWLMPSIAAIVENAQQLPACSSYHHLYPLHDQQNKHQLTTYFLKKKKKKANHIYIYSHVYMHAKCTLPHKYRGYRRIHARGVCGAVLGHFQHRTTITASHFIFAVTCVVRSMETPRNFVKVFLNKHKLHNLIKRKFYILIITIIKKHTNI